MTNNPVWQHPVIMPFQEGFINSAVGAPKVVLKKTAPTPYETDVKTHFGLITSTLMASFAPKQFVCGCEFEIESIVKYNHLPSNEFIIENDHSLRNNGKEFKTHPSSYEKTLQLFDYLHTHLVVDKDPFSERTSIHVHVNVRDLGLKQVRQFVLLYALLEPLFFEFVGEKRKSSIYCVPLNYTFLPSYYKLSIVALLDRWKNNKYTAFNILPINTFGTIEFRHLYGTDNREVFKTWLTSIKDLYEFVANTPELDVCRLINQNTVAEIAKQMIPLLSNHLPESYINSISKDSLMDVKLSNGGLK